MYSTLAGTKLTVVKEAAAHNGRKLQQVGAWHVAACDNSLPCPLALHSGLEQVAQLACRRNQPLAHTLVLWHARPARHFLQASTAVATLLAALPGDAEAVPKSVRPVSNAAFAVAKAGAMLTSSGWLRCSVHPVQQKPARNKSLRTTAGCLHDKVLADGTVSPHSAPITWMKHDGVQGEHEIADVHEEHSKHGKVHKQGKSKGGKVHGKHHWKHHGEWHNDDDDHHWHGKGHGKGHGKHWKHHNFSAKDMVRHVALSSGSGCQGEIFAGHLL